MTRPSRFVYCVYCVAMVTVRFGLGLGLGLGLELGLGCKVCKGIIGYN
jgi:hypothetical protein